MSAFSSERLSFWCHDYWCSLSVLYTLGSWRASENSHQFSILEDLSLATVLQSETLVARPTVVSSPVLGGQVEQEVTLMTWALDIARAISCGLGPLISNGDNGHISVLLAEGHHRAGNEGTKYNPTVWFWEAFGADDEQTLKPESRQDSQAHMCLLPPWCFP